MRFNRETHKYQTLTCFFTSFLCMVNAISSMHFGMTFWLDDDNEFCYCPTFASNEPDKDNWNYVSEWDDWSDVDMTKLFNIHRELVINQQIQSAF